MQGTRDHGHIIVDDYVWKWQQSLKVTRAQVLKIQSSYISEAFEDELNQMLKKRGIKEYSVALDFRGTYEAKFALQKDLENYCEEIRLKKENKLQVLSKGAEVQQKATGQLLGNQKFVTKFLIPPEQVNYFRRVLESMSSKFKEDERYGNFAVEQRDEFSYVVVRSESERQAKLFED